MFEFKYVSKFNANLIQFLQEKRLEFPNCVSFTSVRLGIFEFKFGQSIS